MTTPTEATNLREELDLEKIRLQVIDIIDRERSRYKVSVALANLIYTLKLDVLGEIDEAREAERTTVLPDGFSGQDIANCTNELDQGHMRGFNECLEYIKKLQGEK